MMSINDVMTNVFCFLIRLTTDDPGKYAGGPVGLQVIGRRFEEEKVLDILEIIANAIGVVE
jgi:Asp-tRNA(Asn)/Glu-tRNA(Gln) amidotransferase A subunit family amidase